MGLTATALAFGAAGGADFQNSRSPNASRKVDIPPASYR